MNGCSLQSEDSPPVTWLLPVRNAMPYLREALASMAAQTHPHAAVLAWDDGSTDGSLEELQRWIPRRLAGRIISEPSPSLGVTLSRLVEAAKTELCARMDGDDVCEPDRLAKQVAFMQANPQVAVVGSNIRFIDDAGDVVAGAWHRPLDNASIRWRLRFCNALNHPTVVFRRSAVLRAGNYRNIQPSQDYELWLRMMLAGEHMANLAEPLVRYRRHANTISATRTTHEKECDGLRQPRPFVARMLADLLPGLTHDEAVRCWRLLAGDTTLAVALRDLRLIRRAARRASEADDCDYMATPLFRQQMRQLMHRWAARSLPWKRAA